MWICRISKNAKNIWNSYRQATPADLKNINIDALAKDTNGYSGADIEGVVKDAVEDAFANGKDKLELEDIKRAIKNTQFSYWDYEKIYWRDEEKIYGMQV